LVEKVAEKEDRKENSIHIENMIHDMNFEREEEEKS